MNRRLSPCVAATSLLLLATAACNRAGIPVAVAAPPDASAVSDRFAFPVSVQGSRKPA